MAIDLVQELLRFQLGQFQVYGLFFLLGTLTVAAWSDLKHMSAQSEFVEVWGAILVAFVLLDLNRTGFVADTVFMAKWGLIAALSILSWEKIGVLFKVAPADVFAMAATASLLSPLLVVAFYGVTKSISIPLGRLLSGGRSSYPFLPVALISTAAVLSCAFALGWAASI